MRRRTAVALRKSGLSTRDVARRVGSVPSSVTRWEQAFDRRGEHGLDSIPQAGGISRLAPTQRKQLIRFLLRGPTAFGWRTHLWTLSRVAELIVRKFGVQYHLSHVHRMLRALGFTPQKPARLARERDDKMVAEFRKKTWPAVKKKRAGSGAR